MGAMALFGEKYGDTVRAIRFGSSIELCGGTHVPATGRIGLFLLVGESAVAAGIRRIEAVTGEAAHQYMKERLQTLGKIGALLKNPTHPFAAVEGLKTDLSHAHKTIEELQHRLAGYEKGEILAAARLVNGIQVMIGTTDLDAAALKDVAFQIKDQYPNAFFLMGSVKDGKPMLTLALGKDLVQGKQWNAGQLIKEWSKHIRGGGGGQPFFATAGGQDPSGLEVALETARQFVEQ
jgi:alanyl-tRNA synthetase